VRRNVTRRTSATTTKPLVGENWLDRQDLNNLFKNLHNGEKQPFSAFIPPKIIPRTVWCILFFARAEAVPVSCPDQLSGKTD